MSVELKYDYFFTDMAYVIVRSGVNYCLYVASDDGELVFIEKGIGNPTHWFDGEEH